MEINFLEVFINPSKRVYWLYIVSSLIIAAIYLWFFKREKRIILNKKLWLHKSAILDYKYFVLSFFLKVFFLIPILFGAKEVAIFLYEFLDDQYGYMKINLFSYEVVVILYTLSLFIVSDFTRYWLHRFLHMIPFLWEFHKVHHSAKVLNPITFYRVHPVENLLFGLRYSLSIGFVSGIFLYFFGAMISVVEFLGINILLFFFSLAGSNLRHSHIKLKYPKVLENFFISPYQHQIHHSSKYTHKNFGGYLAIWDKIFGTLVYSKDIKRIKIGIFTNEFNSLYEIVINPFKKIFNKTNTNNSY